MQRVGVTRMRGQAECSGLNVVYVHRFVNELTLFFTRGHLARLVAQAVIV